MTRRAGAATSPAGSPAGPPSGGNPRPDAPPESPRPPRRRRRVLLRRWWTHPLTGRQIVIRAADERELLARVERLDRMRRDLRDGLVTADEFARTLRRLTYGPVRVERAALAYARRPGLSPRTASRVRSWVSSTARELAALDLDALSPDVVQRWIDRLRGDGCASSTIGTAWRTLGAIHDYAAARGWADAARPWGDWRPRLRGRAARGREAARSPEEIARLLAAARELDALDAASSRVRLGNLEARVACVVLAGMRQGEIAGLRSRDLDAGASTVTIARQWNTGRLPKGGRVVCLRVLPELLALLAEARERLERLGLVRAGDDAPVFPDPSAAARGSCRHMRDGSRPLPEGELRRAVARAELPHPERWVATSLRDTFALLEAEAHAGDLHALSQRTRHASVSSLVRYLQSRSRAPAAPGFQLPPATSPRALPPASNDKS